MGVEVMPPSLAEGPLRGLIDNADTLHRWSRWGAPNSVASRIPGCSHRRAAMNIHHLELFYHVARNGGISRAARAMPYGIQQPAISGQILQLEAEIGAKLFERTPFRLTPAGEELWAAVAPFFDGLERLPERIARRLQPRLALGAAEFILSEHLPRIVDRIRAKAEGFRLGLRSGYQQQLEAWLLEGQLDVAITPVDRKPNPALRHAKLVALPLVLAVPASSGHRDAQVLLSGRRSDTLPLISLPPTESAARLFQAELRRRKLDWAVEIEASSLSLLERYVENGYGAGVTVDRPGLARHRGLRLLPLAGFPPLELFALWSPTSGELATTAVAEIRAYARDFG